MKKAGKRRLKSPVPDISPEQFIFEHKYSEVVRKAKTYLLISSLVSIVIATTGLNPTQISALGLEFTETNRHALLWVLIAVVLYFQVFFVVHFTSEYIAFKHRLRALESKTRRKAKITSYRDWWKGNVNYLEISIGTRSSLMFIDYWVPLVFGAVADSVIVREMLATG